MTEEAKLEPDEGTVDEDDVGRGGGHMDHMDFRILRKIHRKN